MRRIFRLVTFFIPAVLFLTPYFAAALPVTYPSCTDVYSTCRAGEVCAYATGTGATPTIGTCTLLPGITTDKISYPSCTNDANCAGHPGEYCTYLIGSTDRVGTCALPDTISNSTSSYIPPPPANSGTIGCPPGQVPNGLYCVTPAGPPAYSGINAYYLQGYATSIVNIINGLIAPVLLALAFIFFLFGVYRYFFLGATSDTERETGRQFILWSVIGFVVIFSLWGLVAIVGSTFGLTAGGSAPPYPTL